MSNDEQTAATIPAVKYHDDLVKSGNEIARLKRELAQSKHKADAYFAELHHALARQKFLDDTSRDSIDWKRIVKSSNDHESIPLFCFSDWHVEETVDPKTVNNLNEYNPEIAQKRIRKVIANSVQATEAMRSFTKIKDVIVWLGGDIINGYIHEENVESNSMSPAEASLFAQDEIASGIQFIQKELNPKKISIVCNYGNHGRTTQKKRHGTGAKNSYEWLMYEQLSRLFKSPNVYWQISRGYHSYVQLYDWHYRFHHGDGMNYRDGIGGITIPVNKAIASWNKTRNVNVDIFGHFHQYNDCPWWLSNGCIVGYNAYAVSIRAPYQPPSQTLCLVSKRRGKILSMPIYCD